MTPETLPPSATRPEQIALDFAPPGDLIARLRQAGLPVATAVSLHQNRRVMLSFDAAGGLRVHRGYVRAPDRIIEAIVAWATPRISRRVRRSLARVFLEFSVHADAPARPSRPRPAPEQPGDAERLARLQALHLDLNARWFDGALGDIHIELSSRMRRKLGHYAPRSTGEPAIAISRRHLRRDGWPGVTDTLLHEMVHQWQDESGLRVDHGPHFRRKAREVGIAPCATVAAEGSAR